jgi:hypothetical protein
MARGRPVVIIQAAFALACIAIAGPGVAVAQTGLDLPGITISQPSLGTLRISAPAPAVSVNGEGAAVVLPGLSLSKTAVLPAASVDLNRSGMTAVLPGATISGAAAVTPTSLNVTGSSATVVLAGATVSRLATVTPTSLNATPRGTTMVLSGATVPGVATVTPTSLNVTPSGTTVVLSGATVSGVATVTPASLRFTGTSASVALPNAELAGLSVAPTPLSANLAGQGPLLELPVVAVSAPGQQTLMLLDKSLLGDVASQISPITQLFAGIGVAETLAPLEHLLSGLAFGDVASSECAGLTSSAVALPPASDISTWNAFSTETTEHEGFRVNGSQAAAACGPTLPFQTVRRAHLPGAVWDASSALGLKRGTLHVGFSGGASEMDTLVKSSATLRDAGFAQGGSARMTSWSVGGFSVLTADNWYAGSAVGSTWGRTESRNFVLGSASDYDTSAFVVAGFLGTVLPLTDDMRFDLRGTLTYQRTVGDAHSDSLGLAYGEHTIEAANAILSGRLFGVFRHGDLTIRPFMQAGVTRHLSYANELEIGGVGFALEEADVSIFAATGLDFEIDKALQLSVGVRHDWSQDHDSLTGRIGFSARLN